MNKTISKIVQAGLIVGTLDISAAFLYFFIKTGKNPLFILKYIASGILGKEAYAGGNGIYLVGLILHYLIAFSFTTLFFIIFPHIKALLKNRVVTGIIYGTFVWVIMNLIVVPLSNVSRQPLNLTNALINGIILIVCIGIPLSFLANRFYKKESLNY